MGEGGKKKRGSKHPWPRMSAIIRQDNSTFKLIQVRAGSAGAVDARGP
jgi:hypothetical protein